jgi:hypothetical protein
METALYFPLMRVPEASWFTQVLLYWDGAASIIPRSLLGSPESDRDVDHCISEFGSYTYGLIRAGLVRPYDPTWLLREHSGRGDFYGQFLILLEEQGLQRSLDRFTRLHIAKGDYSLFGVLERLAVASKTSPEWYEVEKRTADLYMAYLAGAICGYEDFFPVADTGEYLSMFVPSSGETPARLRTLRYEAITEVLPVPSRPVAPAELASFKDRHGEELHRLRVHLDGRLADLATVDDPFLHDTMKEGIFQEIADEVAVLKEQMSKRRWPRVALVGIGGILASALSIGTAIADGGSALALSLGIGAGVVSMGPAGFEAADLLGSPQSNKRSPLAYAALAETL